MSGMEKLYPGLGASAGEVQGPNGPVPVIGVIIPNGPNPGDEETIFIELAAARAFVFDLNACIQAAIKRQDDHRRRKGKK